MLLRRITEHVKAQNWTAVALDFLIVVVGVFVGLQVQNWSETRANQQQEQNYLIRLYEDIQISHTAMVRNVERLKTQVADQSLLMDALKTCSVTSELKPTLSRGFSQLGYINPPYLLQRTIDELSDRGDLDIIKSSEIKQNLVDIIRQYQGAKDASDTVFRIVEHHRFVIEENVLFEDLQPDGRYSATGTAVYDINTLCAKVKLPSQFRRSACKPTTDKFPVQPF